MTSRDDSDAAERAREALCPTEGDLESWRHLAPDLPDGDIILRLVAEVTALRELVYEQQRQLATARRTMHIAVAQAAHARGDEPSPTRKAALVLGLLELIDAAGAVINRVLVPSLARELGELARVVHEYSDLAAAFRASAPAMADLFDSLPEAAGIPAIGALVTAPQRRALAALHRWLHSPAGDCALIEDAQDFHTEVAGDDRGECPTCLALDAQEREECSPAWQDGVHGITMGLTPQVMHAVRELVKTGEYGRTVGSVMARMMGIGLDTVRARMTAPSS